jgi:hypothetical protein
MPSLRLAASAWVLAWRALADYLNQREGAPSFGCHLVLGQSTDLSGPYPGGQYREVIQAFLYACQQWFLAMSVASFQLKAHVKNFLLIVSMVATVAWVSSGSAHAANASADAATAASQATSKPALETSAAAAAGYKASDIKVVSTAHQVTITVVNSKLNAGLSAVRRDEASKIMKAVEKAMAGKVEFEQVMMMHLDYVARQGTRSKIVQGFDFNKSPSGSFVPHIT